MIYFIADCEYVKVGYARDISKRVTSLQCANPRPFTMLASCEGEESLELLLHRHLPDRVNRDREWFRITPVLMGLIDDVNQRGEIAVHDFIQSVKSERRSNAVDWEAHDKKFHAELASVFSGLHARLGTKAIADALGCSPQSVNLYCKGDAILLGPKFVKLVKQFPEAADAFPAITNLILQAERMAA